MIIIKQQGVYTLRQIIIIKIAYLKKFNVVVKGSKILVPRVSSCRILSKIITRAFAPHFKSSVWLLGHAIADSFLIEFLLFSFPQNVSAVLQKVMAVIWTKEKCLNSHGIYRQAVQVLMTCLKFLAYLINNGNWGSIGTCYYLTRRAQKKIIHHLADK